MMENDLLFHEQHTNEELYRRMGFDRKIKDCYFDPCAVDEDMRPLPVEGYQLLARDL